MADIPDIMLYNQHDIIQHSTRFNPSILANKAGLINLSIWTKLLLAAQLVLFFDGNEPT